MTIDTYAALTTQGDTTISGTIAALQEAAVPEDTTESDVTLISVEEAEPTPVDIVAIFTEAQAFAASLEVAGANAEIRYAGMRAAVMLDRLLAKMEAHRRYIGSTG